MPKHEFAMIKQPVQPGVVYDEYEPQKYDCLAFDDEIIEAVSEKTADIDTYWHSVNRPAKGLAYYGITLIPPNSMDGFLKITQEYTELSALSDLLKKAKEQKQFIVHFGI
ncbi:MAG: hypothetical protein ACI4W6_03205 [Acutalibacteraceae bacterium]